MVSTDRDVIERRLHELDAIIDDLKHVEPKSLRSRQRIELSVEYTKLLRKLDGFLKATPA